MNDDQGIAQEQYVLRLYISAVAPRSSRAVVNTRLFCEKYLAGRYELEILNIAENVSLATQDQVVAAPTLIKIAPSPTCRFIGDMSNPEPLLEAFGLARREAKLQG